MNLDNLSSRSSKSDSPAKKDPPNFALLLSKRMGGDKSSADSEGDSEMDAPGNNEQDRMEDSACKSMMSSLKSDNVSGFKTALCDFLEMYQDREKSEGE